MKLLARFLLGFQDNSYETMGTDIKSYKKMPSIIFHYLLDIF